MSRSLRWCAFRTLGLSVGLVGYAQDEMTGEQILRKSEDKHRAKDERGVVEMVLVSASNKKSRRTMETYFKQAEGEDDHTLLRFLSPPTIRGTALLTREASGRADDQWVYLPAFKKAKKIAASGRTNRFAGTDFTFEDLRTEDFSANTYERVKDETIEIGKESFRCYVIRATPKDLDVTGYSKRLIYMEKERLLTVRVKFFDHKKRHQKTMTNRGFEQVSGLWRFKRSMMEDHLEGSKTLWQFKERKINPGLAGSLFTKRNLERGL